MVGSLNYETMNVVMNVRICYVIRKCYENIESLLISEKKIKINKRIHFEVIILPSLQWMDITVISLKSYNWLELKKKMFVIFLNISNIYVQYSNLIKCLKWRRKMFIPSYLIKVYRSEHWFARIPIRYITQHQVHALIDVTSDTPYSRFNYAAIHPLRLSIRLLASRYR